MTLYPPSLKRGVTIAPWLILIPQWAKTDIAYRMHEQVHAEQQRRLGVLTFWFRYLISPAARQTFEVEAYQVQINYGASLSYCADQLANGYNLDIDYPTAMKLLDQA